VEYAQIVAATERQFQDEERDIEARQAEMDTAQALLDRRRRALKRKRGNFERLLAGWKTLDVEVVSGKPSRSDAADEDPDGDERGSRRPTRTPREASGMDLLVSRLRLPGGLRGRSSQALLRRLPAPPHDQDAGPAPDRRFLRRGARPRGRR
jgi:hypothetical protein